MTTLSIDDRALADALRSEGLDAPATARVLAAVTPARPACEPDVNRLPLGIGGSGLAVLLGVLLALASAIAFLSIAIDHGRGACLLVTVAYLAGFAVVGLALRGRIASAALAMVAVGAAASASATAGFVLARPVVFGHAGDAPDLPDLVIGGRLGLGLAVLVGVAVMVAAALALRVDAAWNMTTPFVVGLLAAVMPDDPSGLLILGAAAALVALGTALEHVGGRHAGTGATAAGAALTLPGFGVLLQSERSVLAAGVCILAVGALRGRPGLLVAGTIATWSGAVAVVAAETDSLLLAALVFLAGATALVVAGIVLASAARREAVLHRLHR